MQFLLRRLSFDGRASRREFWLTQIIIGASSGMIALILNGSMARMPMPQASFHLSPALASYLVLAAVTAWFQLALGFRRAHDLGETGLPLVVIATGQAMFIASTLLPDVDVLRGIMSSGAGFFLFGLGIVWLMFTVYFNIRLWFFPGDANSNTYGNPARMIEQRQA